MKDRQMAARFIRQASSCFPITNLRTNSTDILSKQVADTRPPGMRPNYTDASSVTKYELPPSEYEKRDDSVLAWKKANKLGRFDPVGIPRTNSSPVLSESLSSGNFSTQVERSLCSV
jgi:hypothetical protein